MTISEDFERFQYLKNTFYGKRKPLSRNWNNIFSLKALRLNTHHFHTKLPNQKPMLRLIEWWVQNEPIAKNGVLPVTTLFFWKSSFSLRTSYWCTIFVLFVSPGVLFDGAFSLWVTLKRSFPKDLKSDHICWQNVLMSQFKI